MNLDPTDFEPEGRQHHWRHKTTGLIIVGRDGQTLEQVVAEINSAEI